MESVDPRTLAPHPRNVRVHPEENLQAIMCSLSQFGQQRPLVVDAANQVIAGCGTLESIRRLGWKSVQIVRTQLKGMEAEAYAIADNKTGDMSKFDYEKLSDTLRNIEGEGLDLTLTGFRSYELEPLLQAEWNPGEVGVMPNPLVDDKHRIKFTPEQWHAIESALYQIRETETEYDTSTDAAALSTFCYRMLNK